MLAIAILVASISAQARVVPGLVAVMMRDKAVSACAQQSDKTPQVYLSGAFHFRSVRLHGGEQMIVATATDPCLALGQSTRIMIYENTTRGYRRVLDEVTLPDLAAIHSDGTVVLPTHESMGVIFEATYSWNGTSYVFAPLRSHRYDVALGERRPYETLVRPMRGASAVVLSGSVAYNFGDDYIFQAAAGETIAVELIGSRDRAARVALYYKDDVSSIGELDAPGRFSRKALRSGTYHLLVWGTDESDEMRLSRYEVRLSLR